MARWQPGTRERLQVAALELFGTRGFEQTTAAEIAAAVGLTERTFFRHFADKREVLFDGQNLLVEAFVAGVGKAQAEATPLELVAAALRGAATFFPDERRPWSRARQAVIEANPPLHERERSKMAVLGGVLATALRERGLPDPAATLAAESAVTVFGTAFALWLDPAGSRSFEQLALTLLDELGTLLAPTPARPTPP
jgi:AcrR family transcriptional regulator